MVNNNLADTLQALATGAESRSETARLRDIYDKIESALAAGVSRAAILTALHENGFTLGQRSFDNALYRIRKQRKQAGHSPSIANSSARNETQPPSEELPVSTHDSAGMDKKQRRERLADKYIKPDTTNPLLKRIQGKG